MFFTANIGIWKILGNIIIKGYNIFVRLCQPWFNEYLVVIIKIKKKTFKQNLGSNIFRLGTKLIKLNFRYNEISNLYEYDYYFDIINNDNYDLYKIYINVVIDQK